MGKRGIVAFAFGTPATIWSNICIRNIALAYVRRDRALVFTQADIQFQTDLRVSVTYCKEVPGQPPPTLRIAREAIRWALLNRIDSITVVAAKPHLWRCMRDMSMAAKEMGCQWIKIVASTTIDQYQKEQWFCPDSTQPRTQTEKEWRKRERILELMPFFIYRHVAS